MRIQAINNTKVPSFEKSQVSKEQLATMEKRELQDYRTITDSGLIGLGVAGVTSAVVAITKTPNPVRKVLWATGIATLTSLFVLPIKNLINNSKK